MEGENDRHAQINGGVWLIGLGILLITGKWWPGIMFLIGIGAIVEGFLEGKRGWYALQGGFWAIVIGLWAMFHFHPAFFLVAVGVSMVIAGFVRPPGFDKPKPVTDNYLE